ncbi:hypothetical protein ACH5RR_034277 [Cinchona calisaya]|uniref:Neprosin PEP catalytic domain-containing protein n=1 Tax=Cinchona calisaya TaxID=153742 RepID=A0ABD2YBR1_9GENT
MNSIQNGLEPMIKFNSMKELQWMLVSLKSHSQWTLIKGLRGYRDGKERKRGWLILDEVEGSNIAREERQKNFVVSATKFAGIRLSNGGQGYIGAKAYIAIHKPKVDLDSHQYSAASIIIEKGDNQIQAGWIIYPDLYHDNNPRFYTSWTKDKHRSTGCYNTDCQGFVIVSDVYPLNYAFPEISDPNKAVRHDVKVSIEQLDVTGRWYVSLNDSPLGQPPTDTSPPMGSGKFYGDNPYRTAYMKMVEVLFSDNTYRPPPDNLIQEVISRCYFEGWKSYSSDEGYHFLFGGKGGKDRISC